MSINLSGLPQVAYIDSGEQSAASVAGNASQTAQGQPPVMRESDPHSDSLPQTYSIQPPPMQMTQPAHQFHPIPPAYLNTPLIASVAIPVINTPLTIAEQGRRARQKRIARNIAKESGCDGERVFAIREEIRRQCFSLVASGELDEASPEEIIEWAATNDPLFYKHVANPSQLFGLIKENRSYFRALDIYGWRRTSLLSKKPKPITHIAQNQSRTDLVGKSPIETLSSKTRAGMLKPLIKRFRREQTTSAKREESRRFGQKKIAKVIAEKSECDREHVFATREEIRRQCFPLVVSGKLKEEIPEKIIEWATTNDPHFYQHFFDPDQLLRLIQENRFYFRAEDIRGWRRSLSCRIAPSTSLNNKKILRQERIAERILEREPSLKRTVNEIVSIRKEIRDWCYPLVTDGALKGLSSSKIISLLKSGAPTFFDAFGAQVGNKIREYCNECPAFFTLSDINGWRYNKNPMNSLSLSQEPASSPMDSTDSPFPSIKASAAEEPSAITNQAAADIARSSPLLRVPDEPPLAPPPIPGESPIDDPFSQFLNPGY